MAAWDEEEDDLVSRSFSSEDFVIITSTRAIDAVTQKVYLLRHWDKLCTKNARLALLTGIHGLPDGSIKRDDKNDLDYFPLNFNTFIIEGKKADLKAKNAVIKMINLGDYMTDINKVDDDKLVRDIEEYEPTKIILAFCNTKCSELNDLFRSSGIYSYVIMRNDREKISGGRCFMLDHEQRDALKTYIEKKLRNLFLWGSSGTGKTILLVEALKVKIATLKKEGRKMKIYVTTFKKNETTFLRNKLKNEYLMNIQEDFTVTSIQELSTDLKLNIQFNKTQPCMTFNKVTAALSRKYSEYEVVLLCDECKPNYELGEPDWSKTVTRENVHYLVALQPQGEATAGQFNDEMYSDIDYDEP